MARDRLVSLLGIRQDDEVLDRLAEVHHLMGDLPAAGALWFVTGRDDETSRPAIAAWEERHGGDLRRWNSIPSPVRRHASSPSLEALRTAQVRESRQRTAPPARSAEPTTWGDRVFAGIAVTVLLSFVAMFLLGVVTVGRWIL